MKVAIVADWLTTMGGGEQVVFALSELFPKAPVFTSVHSGHFPKLEGREIRTTWLQKLPAPLRHKHQFLLPVLPNAFLRLDMSGFDVILSSSSAFSKCITKTNKEQIHICYCHTPTRFLYHARDEYQQGYPLPTALKPARYLLPKILDRLTKQDIDSASKVDHFICNSNFVKDRIYRYYSRDAKVIYPSVETTRFHPSKNKENYFLALGRFIPYKKFDLLIETFASNGIPLKLAGIGPELEACKLQAKKLSADNIEFLGFVPDEDLPDLYARAKAFLFPAEEDFGITPVEAMASGTPVIAYGKGGATESVTKKTGILFDEQTPTSLQSAIEQFNETEPNFVTEALVDRAAQFDTEKFKENITMFVNSATKHLISR